MALKYLIGFCKEKRENACAVVSGVGNMEIFEVKVFRAGKAFPGQRTVKLLTRLPADLVSSGAIKVKICHIYQSGMDLALPGYE